MKVAVLLGGVSSEREISIKTGNAVAQALQRLGHQVRTVDIQTRELPEFQKDEIAFISLHGEFGEDGKIQRLLEAKQIPYTGSRPLGCAASFDKSYAKACLKAAGIPVPQIMDVENLETLVPPFILKPVDQGSSIGVFRVLEEDQKTEALRAAKATGMRMIAESMILGRECTVGILGDVALPVVEIVVDGGFYDFEHKYTAGRSRYECPARLDEETAKKIQSVALQTHRTLECDVVSRVDVMLDVDGNPFVLELNSIPGMTELSLLPRAAQAAGISFDGLCQRILELSAGRWLS